MHAVSELGYHGTSSVAAGRILVEGFNQSRNTYDWLGTGTYFFQDAPVRAWEWASERYPDNPAVLRASIDLGDCMDLLDQTWKRALGGAYDGYLSFIARTGTQLPRQSAGAHNRDAAVIDYFVSVLADAGITIRSVRAAFREGEPIFEGSAISTGDHVQIAVRDHAAIATIVREAIL